MLSDGGEGLIKGHGPPVQTGFIKPKFHVMLKACPSLSYFLLQDQPYFNLINDAKKFQIPLFGLLSCFRISLYIALVSNVFIIKRNMSYYCHECTQRREIMYNPLACTVCGSEIVDAVRLLPSNIKPKLIYLCTSS